MCSEMTTPRFASIQNGTTNISLSLPLLNFPVYYLFLVKNDKLLWEIELLMVGACLVILVGLLILEKPLPLFTGHPNWFVPSLRSKHFRGVGEQRKTQEQEKWCESYFSRRQNIEDLVPIFLCFSTPRKLLLCRLVCSKKIKNGKHPLCARRWRNKESSLIH